MKVLITGAGGFIGQNLISHLAGTQTLVALDRQRRSDATPDAVQWILSDLANSEALADALQGVEAVVHLAALKGSQACQAHPQGAVAANVTATLTLVQAARRAGVKRFLFASTYDLYGALPAEVSAFSERDPVKPTTLYGTTKAVGEQIVLESFKEAVILRLGHVFGPGVWVEHPDVITHFIARACQNQPLVVQGSGRVRIDPIHVEDVCLCIERFLQKDAPAGTYNVASGSAVTIGEVAQRVTEAARKEGIVVSIAHEGIDPPDVDDRAVVIDALRTALPDFSIRPLSAGLTACFKQVLATKPGTTPEAWSAKEAQRARQRELPTKPGTTPEAWSAKEVQRARQRELPRSDVSLNRKGSSL